MMRIPGSRGLILGSAVLVLALALIAWRLLPFKPAPQPAQPTVSGDAGYLDFAAAGPAQLDARALLALGFDPQGADAPPLRLRWRGTPVPTYPLRDAQGWRVLFYVPDGATRFYPYTTLRWERGAEAELMPTHAPESMPQGATTALRTLHLEENARYLSQATADVPWFWQVLYAPTTWTPEVSLPGWTPGPMTVTLRLWSHSSSSQIDPDHVLRLSWGDARVQEWSWDGTGMQSLSATWTPDTPAPLRFEMPAIEGTTAVVWLDALTITYTARLEAGPMVWQAQGEGLSLEGLPAKLELWDVSDALAPVRLVPRPSGALATRAGARYWLGSPRQAQAPLGWRAAQGLDPLPATTDYLVIAPEAFHVALAPLLEARRNAGLMVALVTPQAVYDTWGYGQPDPQALRAFIQNQPALRYVLVVGDGSAAVDGYVGQAGALRVPTPYVRTTYVGETPADGLLGADEAGQPRVAIGRFPAQSVADVQAMVAKTLAWEQQSGAQAVLLSDSENEFSDLIESLSPPLPDAEVIRIDANEAEARSRLLQALDKAPTWLTYCGHGSLIQLSKEALLTLKDSWRQPAFFVSWTCLSAYFIHPEQEGLGEMWMRQPQGGVVAFLGPTGETTTSEQRPYAQAFYAAIETSPHVGDAWIAALGQAGSDDARWSFILLGDPALRVIP